MMLVLTILQVILLVINTLIRIIVIKKYIFMSLPEDSEKVVYQYKVGAGISVVKIKDSKTAVHTYYY